MIREITYVPTLRCNFRCLHCGQNIFIKESEEKSCLQVAQALLPQITKESEIIITGGEPFLKNDLLDFIVTINTFAPKEVKQHIITNGYYVERIRELLVNLPHLDRISFDLSIDAKGELHNEIRGNPHAFEKAMETLSLLSDSGVRVSINTVVQQANLGHLDELKAIILDVFPEIKVKLIPELDELNQTHKFAFYGEQLDQMLLQVKETRDIKYLITQGQYKLKSCHAGLQNIVIAPDAGVYCCITGFCYLENQKDSKYFMGNLMKDSLEDMIDAWGKTRYQNILKGCQGCFSNCEWLREQHDYNVSIPFTAQEKDQIKQWITQSAQPLWQWFDGWHEPECYSWGTLRWMDRSDAVVFYKVNKPSVSQLNINYCSSFPSEQTGRPLTVDVSIDDELYIRCMVLEPSGTIKIYLPDKLKLGAVLEIKFHVSEVWQPCDFEDTSDNRQLGMAVGSIETY